MQYISFLPLKLKPLVPLQITGIKHSNKTVFKSYSFTQNRIKIDKKMPIMNLVGPGSNWISVKVWSWRYSYSVTCLKFNKKNIYHWSTLPACAFDNWKWNSLYNFCHQVHGLTFSFTFFSNFTVQLDWVIFKSWPITQYCQRGIEF